MEKYDLIIIGAGPGGYESAVYAAENFGRNPALINALNRINIAETNEDETMQILQEQLIYTEASRHVTFMYQAVKEAYRLALRYVHDYNDRAQVKGAGV